MVALDRIGYLDIGTIANGVVNTGTVQPSSPTLTGIADLPPDLGLVEQASPGGFAIRSIGSSAATDIPTLSDADGRYARLSSKQTGWTAPTGTDLRTGFDTSTATTAQLAETLKALIDDLMSYGVIGT